MGGWRDVLDVHPAAEIFPLLPAPELRDLADHIRGHGLQQQVVVIETADGRKLLDGRNRLDASELIGEAAEAMRTATVVSVSDPYAYVLGANITRRHLSGQQKLDLIAEVLRAQPAKSDRQIAKVTQASPTTVGKVRAKKEAEGLVSTVDTRTDRRGRQQPAHPRPDQPRPKRESKPRPPKPQVEGVDLNSPAAQLFLDRWPARPLTADEARGLMPQWRQSLRKDCWATLSALDEVEPKEEDADDDDEA